MITPAQPDGQRRGPAMSGPAVSGPVDDQVGGSWSQRRLLAAVDFYQRAREGRPSPCRFHPSCSSYARESLVVHGAGRGTWLAVRRLLRCRPFGPSGYDPVPPPRDAATDGAIEGTTEPGSGPVGGVRHLTVAIPNAVQKG